jgi:tetratricopeptide (TPR) repeat protein
MVDESLFRQLLQSAECEILDFKATNYDLSDENSKVSLLKDLISMANTPREQSARIVLGVKRRPDGSTELLGLDRDLDDADMQSQFSERVVPVPSIQYEVVTYEGKRFGIISVFPEKRGPYFATRSFGERLRRNILYFRRGSKNDVAGPADAHRIYDWFKGRRPSPAVAVPESDAWESLILGLDQFPRDARYILITNRRNCDAEPAADALGLVPWSVVFDFDPSSEAGGLLSVLEPATKDRRPIHRVLRGDRPRFNLNRATHWFFARGIEGRKDSLSGSSYPSWLRAYRREVDEQMALVASLLEPAVTYCVALWDESLSDKHMNATLESAFGAFGDRVNAVIVTDSAASLAGTAESLEVEAIEIPLHQFYQGVRSVWGSREGGSADDLVIPSSSGAPIPFSSDDRSWLEEELEVVGLSAGRVRPEGFDDAAPFLRGAQPSWYELALPLDVQRDNAAAIRRRVERDLQARRTTRINLYHAPGAGGTTVGRRAVWSLHEDYPAMILNQVTAGGTADKISRIAFESGLASLVLIDGGDVAEREIDVLFDELRSRNAPVVLLQVLRRFATQAEAQRAFWIGHELSDAEAQRFFDAYAREQPARRERLRQLLVSGSPREKSAFYFGLEAFGRDFAGLERYVQSRVADLTEPQRKILELLALAHHFGQRALPAQAFAQIAGLPRNRVVRLDRLLPEAAMELLVGGREGEWRPAHELISLTVLEQLLGPASGDRARLWRQSLSRAAIELAEFCRDEATVPSDAMLEVARRVFIYRDNADVIGSERSATGRFSQLIEDIPAQEGQLEVFRALVDLFPDEAHFWSHLGRFLSMRMRDFDQALECVDRAIEIDPQDSVLHHMRGMALRQKIAGVIEASGALSDAIDLARFSSEAFAKSRELNSDNEHGYISEIQMLVRLLDYAGRDTPQGLAGYLRTEGSDPFVREALDLAEDLLNQLRRRKEGEETSTYEDDCRARLDALYGRHEDALQLWDSMLSRSAIFAPPVRRQIVWTHLARRERRWRNLGPNEVSRTVSLLEQNVQQEPGEDVNYRLWLQAIRCERPGQRNLEAIIERVAYWRTNSGSLDSLFYLYVLYALLAIEGSTTAAQDAEVNLDRCRAMAKNRRNRTRSLEWLAPGQGIHRLVPAPELGEWDREQEFWSDAGALARMTGRISRIRGPQAGEVLLECGLPAFFVPARGGFAAGRSENQAVAFFLGFSFEGLRAWSVEAAGTIRGDGSGA